MAFICPISQDTVLYHTLLFRQGSSSTAEIYVGRKLWNKASFILTILPVSKANCSKCSVFFKVRMSGTDRFPVRDFRFPMSIPMSVVPSPGLDSSWLSSKWSSVLFSTQVLCGVAFEAFQPCTFLLFISAKHIIFPFLFSLFSEITNARLLWIWQRHKRNFENLRELSHFTESNLSSQIEQQSLVVLQMLFQQ